MRAESIIRPTLYQILRVNQAHYSRRRVEMVFTVLRYQAFYGRCFASAKRIATESIPYVPRGPGGSRHRGSGRYPPGAWREKSWDRLLATLRRHGLATTSRYKRANGQLGVNLIDLRGLWFLLIRRLGRLLFESSAKIFQVLQSRRSLCWKVGLSSGYAELVIWPLSAPPVPGVQSAKGQISTIKSS